MKQILACLLVAATPAVASATVAASSTSNTVAVAEPVLLAGSALITMHNLNSLAKPSLLWSSAGIAAGALTLALSSSGATMIPVADAVLGMLSFFVGLARLQRSLGEGARRPAARLEVGWRTAQVLVRY